MRRLDIIFEVITIFYPLIKEFKKHGEFESRIDDKNMIITLEFKFKNTDKRLCTIIIQSGDPKLHAFFKEAMRELKKKYGGYKEV